MGAADLEATEVRCVTILFPLPPQPDKATRRHLGQGCSPRAREEVASGPDRCPGGPQGLSSVSVVMAPPDDIDLHH